MTSPDLIRELQAARPAAPPSLRAHVREISASKAVGAPRLRRGFQLRRPVFIALPLAAALALAIGTAGVIGLADSGNNTGAVEALAQDQTARPESSGDVPGSRTFGVAPGARTDKGAPSTAIAPDDDRAQRVSATLTVKVADSDDVSRASQEALDVVQALGGHVVSASVATGESGSATLTVRVPVDKTQDAIVRLSSLGTIVSQQVSIDDLQQTIDDLLRRTRSLQAQIVRITARLDSEPLSAEERASLELRRKRLQAELRSFRRGVAATKAESRFATIQLTVVTPDALGVVPTPSRLDRALDKAVEVLVWEGVIALALLLVTAPFAILALAAWLLRSAYRKREDERLLAAS
jgi:hypothetical protein